MFLGFTDVYSFCGFITSILYNLVPIAFFYQLKHGVIKNERISIIALLSLYCNGFIYFLISAFQTRENESINPMDFCNLLGIHLGFIYLILYIYNFYFKTNKKKGIISFISLIIGSLAFFLLAWNLIDENDNFWAKLFKYIGIFFNILQNLPLGFSIIYIIKNKVSEKYILLGTSFGLINTVVWFIWAFYSIFISKNNENKDKPYQTFIANIIAISMHIFQIFFFCKYRKNEGEEKNESDNNEPLADKEIKRNEEENIESTNNNKNKESDVFEDFM